MNLFCKETEAHLSFLPSSPEDQKKEEEKSNKVNNLITPELWLKDSLPSGKIKQEKSETSATNNHKAETHHTPEIKVKPLHLLQQVLNKSSHKSRKSSRPSKHVSERFDNHHQSTIYPPLKLGHPSLAPPRSSSPLYFPSPPSLIPASKITPSNLQKPVPTSANQSVPHSFRKISPPELKPKPEVNLANSTSLPSRVLPYLINSGPNLPPGQRGASLEQKFPLLAPPSPLLPPPTVLVPYPILIPIPVPIPIPIPITKENSKNEKENGTSKEKDPETKLCNGVTNNSQQGLDLSVQKEEEEDGDKILDKEESPGPMEIVEEPKKPTENMSSTKDALRLARRQRMLQQDDLIPKSKRTKL